ncbi:MAG: LysR family transcriptional regulator [Neomegalonema sp.]|nr:LysR family transcriptional regulator [Neomegalonema sp.]
MITISDCQTVLALHEERHFARAAALLGVTQPALTTRLQRIEQYIGARLFERDRSGVRPTPAGMNFIDGARATMEAADRAVMAARNAAEGMGETLVVGMTQVAAYRVVEPVLRAFLRNQPKARILLREGTTARLEAQIENREIDIAFVHPPLHTSSIVERQIAPGDLVRLDLAPEKTPHVVSYPRAEAPVLMGELGRVRDAAGQTSIAEADTMLGAILLSRAGYGSCIVDRDFAANTVGPGVCQDAPTAGALDISLAWRALDRRRIVELFVETALAHRLLEEQTGKSAPE